MVTQKRESHKIKHSDRKQESCYQERGMVCGCPGGRGFYLGWTGSTNGQRWQLRVWVAQSRLTLRSPGLYPTRLICPWNFPGKNTGVVAIPFSRGSSWPRDRTCISCTGRQILCYSATREAQNICIFIAHSRCCTAETNRTLWSNYPPIKNK